MGFLSEHHLHTEVQPSKEGVIQHVLQQCFLHLLAVLLKYYFITVNFNKTIKIINHKKITHQVSLHLPFVGPRVVCWP